MNASQRLLAVLATLATLTVTAGCSADPAPGGEAPGGEARGGGAASSGQGGPRAAPGAGKTEKKADTTGLVLPIDAYDVSMGQMVRTQLAQNTLVSECLARYGLTITYPKAIPYQGSPHARRYGPPESLATAQKYGFHMAQGDPRSFTKDMMVRHPKDVVEVLGGRRDDGTGTQLTSFRGQPVPEGGCAREAQRKLARGTGEGERAGHADTAAAIKARSFENAKKDPRVKAAEKKWVACMAGRGYTDYKRDSFDAVADTRWNTPKATSEEITVAVASWTCGKEGDVVGTWVAVETAYQNEQIAKNAETLEDDRKRLVEEGKRIDAIIAGTGGAAS
ncbi:hypothetical protein [Streptomyces narbonensis]|uniref:hypothetical protein n=1 Tax=Streptomyces narbonensis TaxID=67333 RepID=UPI0033D258F1